MEKRRGALISVQNIKSYFTLFIITDYNRLLYSSFKYAMVKFNRVRISRRQPRSANNVETGRSQN